MRHNILRLTLLLMVVLLSSAGVRADWTITVATMDHGTVKASKKTAAEGATITLTVTPDNEYQLILNSLRVEMITDDGTGDTPNLNRAPAVGSFVSLTRTGDRTFTFEMPACHVEVTAAFFAEAPFEIDADAEESDGTETTVSVTVVPDYEGMTFTVGTTTPEEGETPTVVYLPATVTDPGGNVLTISGIEPYAFFGMTSITDIWLPETEEMIQLGENCFLLDDNATRAIHHIATIHTPLWLLDDYALCTAISENYLAGKVKARANAKHRFWTFSCGIDVELPDEVRAYIVTTDGNDGISFTPLETTAILANNGVLLQCPDNEGHSYDVTAVPSSAHPTGSAIATDNARSYPGNLLEPVIRKHHYLAQRNYYVLVNNKFCPVQFEESDALCPACRAVLRMPVNNPHATTITNSESNQ